MDLISFVIDHGFERIASFDHAVVTIADEPFDDVLAAATIHLVDACPTGQRVVAALAKEPVIASVAKQKVIITIVENLDDFIVAIENNAVAVERVVAITTVDDVFAWPTNDQVIATKAHQQVIAIPTIDDIGSV